MFSAISTLVDDAFGLIFSNAFTPQAGIGGIIGVLLIGFRRAAFSNEARSRFSVYCAFCGKNEILRFRGIGCTIGAVYRYRCNLHHDSLGDYNILILEDFSNTAAMGSGAVFIDGMAYEGAGITSKAFANYIPFSNVFLTIAVVLFAVSTMISWSYYGLQSWKYLFGRGAAADMTYKLLFLTFVVIGAAANMKSILGLFRTTMIFAMIFPNMIGLYFLFPVVKKQLNRYLKAIKSFNN